MMTIKHLSDIPADQMTPMFQQYGDLCKEAHIIDPSAIVLFEVGDFYELFFQDAVTASKVLDLVLTSKRVTTNGDRCDLCGIPYHALDRYLRNLVMEGLTVAIVNQGEKNMNPSLLTPRFLSRIVKPQ